MLTHEFPYSPILQFLYTKRLQQAEDPRFGDSVTRTALFFNNPHWLNQQLRDVRPAEQVRELEETAAQPLIHHAFNDSDREIDEEEEKITLDLTASEQALIASITETPDGSLLQDEASILAEETAENEAVAEVVDEWEKETDEASEDDSLVLEVEDEANPIGSIDEEDLEHLPQETTESMELPVVESFVEDDLETKGETEESSSTPVLEDDEPISLTTDEKIEDEELESAENEPRQLEEVNASATSADSLITVISSVEPYDAHPIHTIGIPESSGHQDEPVEHATPAPSLDPSPAEDLLTTESQVEASSEVPEADIESDNDDDAAVLSDQDPMGDPEHESLVIDEKDVEEPLSSGLENMGFSPETLLEESDAAEHFSDEEGAAVFTPFEKGDGWDAFDSLPEMTDEDEDHPDDTEPGLNCGHDQDEPIINPGDLIKMAGLDQHSETELSFEPLHLTDYFASVGVSLPQEEQPDVFGRQSRSFTGWIRSMKRIHTEKNPVVPFTQTESEQIRAGAEQSNEQEEVLTETMAGIYAMQGLTHKAIDIYEKLSLLNPEKSAIFAAKLSELKGKLP